MSRYIILLIVLFVALSTVSGQINVLSFNIRYDNPKDAENNWKYRKDHVAALINYYEADLIGMQEVLKSQLDDLEMALPAFNWLGVGRDDGKEAGEFSPIFYNRAKFEELASSTFWLSETCDVPGKMGWDAVCNRVVTWVKLKQKSSGKVFFLFNTHFDHKGSVARSESAKLILQKIEEIATGFPVLLTGDFNCVPGSDPYQTLTAEEALTDAFVASRSPHYGPKGTYNGFRMTEKDDERRIDMVFARGEVTVLKHAVLTDSKGGRFPSDHFPVLVEVIF